MQKGRNVRLKWRPGTHTEARNTLDEELCDTWKSLSDHGQSGISGMTEAETITMLLTLRRCYSTRTLFW